MAISLGYVTLGPILISAAFVGYLVAGLVGAVVLAFAIFAPSFVMTVIATDLYWHVRHLESVRRAVHGILAAFVGLLAGRWWPCVTLSGVSFLSSVVDSCYGVECYGGVSSIGKPGWRSRGTP